MKLYTRNMQNSINFFQELPWITKCFWIAFRRFIATLVTSKFTSRKKIGWVKRMRKQSFCKNSKTPLLYFVAISMLSSYLYNLLFVYTWNKKSPANWYRLKIYNKWTFNLLLLNATFWKPFLHNWLVTAFINLNSVVKFTWDLEWKH